MPTRSAHAYAQISYEQVIIAGILVLLTILLSRMERLELEKELFISSIRAFVQLAVVGFVLQAIFSSSQWYWTLLTLAVMTVVAGHTAAQRSKEIPKARWIAIVSVGIGGLGTLVILVGLGLLNLHPGM